MIKVIGYSTKNINYSVIYNRSARVLDIESDTMSDDCIPYDDSTACMVWLDKDNVLCEIECIFPVETNKPDSYINKIVQSSEVLPILRVKNEEKIVEIFVSDTQLILTINKNKKSDKKCVVKNLIFHISGDEVVAIESTNFKII